MKDAHQHRDQRDASLDLLGPCEHFVVGQDGVGHVERSGQVRWESA